MSAMASPASVALTINRRSALPLSISGWRSSSRFRGSSSPSSPSVGCGGTDGARLSYEGLTCPNLFTGGENYPGRFEYVPIEDMEACVRTVKCILKNAVK